MSENDIANRKLNNIYNPCHSKRLNGASKAQPRLQCIGDEIV